MPASANRIVSIEPQRTYMGKEEIILYRGETPGAIGLDVHAGYGQTWTTNPEHAAAYAQGPGGYVKQAILPATGKRLVLVGKDADGYTIINWDAVDELQRITGDPYLRRTVECRPMYDAWCEEWTQALIAAGYDSIATEGFEGPEEYVLNMHMLSVRK